MKEKIIEIFKEMLNELVNDPRLRSEDEIYDDYATRIDSHYSGGVSEKKYLEFDFEEGEVKVVTNPTFKISEGKIYVECEEEEADLYVSEYIAGSSPQFLKEINK